MTRSMIVAIAIAGTSALFVPVAASAQTTVTLMKGQNNYSGAFDTRLGNQGGQEGTLPSFSLIQESATSFAIRFLILQSEGGPVPDTATINSATLSFYMSGGPASTFKASRFLKNWTEAGATWSATGDASVPSWGSIGAMGAGSDYLATADGQSSIGDAGTNGCSNVTPDGPFPAACWLNIDVTSGVQAFANGTHNYGWKLAYTGAQIGGTPRDFITSDNPTWSQIRPKLTITYTTTTQQPSGGGTVTLMKGQNNYAGAFDTRLGNQGGQEGTLPSFSLIQESATSFAIRFLILQSEGGPIPASATISSATLSFYMSGGPASTFKASRFLKNWTETGATWFGTGDAGVPAWASDGAMGAGSDYLATPDGQASIGDAGTNGCSNVTPDGPFPAACWLNIDVTSGVQAFANGAAHNYGWKLAYTGAQNGGTPRDFITSDNPTWTLIRPKLTIAYTTGPVGPCDVPSPRFTASTSGLTASFDASGTSDGVPAAMTLTLQFGDGAQVTWGSKTQVQPHSYATAGTYTATMTATNSCGTSLPVSGPVTVTSPPNGPTARLSADRSSGAAPLAVVFDASATTDGGSALTNLHLDFGDQSQPADWTDKTIKQSHSYAGPGLYTATLTATTSSGTSTATQQIDVSGVCSGDVAPTGNPAGKAVPTFHSMSLYYNPPSAPSAAKVWMRYRKACESGWREGHPLWYDDRVSGNGLPYQYTARGSAVRLQPGQKYYFQFGNGSSPETASWNDWVDGTTWPEIFNEGAVIPVTSQSDTLVIADGGDETTRTYKVYDGWTGSSKSVIARGGQGVANPNNEADDSSHGIVVKASFVIVRRVKVTGAAIAGIYVAPGVHDVVIEDCEVSDWAWRPESGRGLGNNPNSWGTFGWNEAGGIHLAGSNSRIVIQRNVITSPHFGSFPWDTGGVSCSTATHPAGPSGIMIQEGASGAAQNVIRYNEITGAQSDPHRWYQDGISGEENFSTKGAPGADSDIYQNIVMNAFDDAIEAEGGGMNVRVWGNYISEAKTAVATTAVHYGPTYVFRNVINHLRMCYAHGTDELAPSAFKSGGSDGYGNGARYLYHNTMLQDGGGGVYGVEAPDNGFGSVTYTTSRNNIFHVRTDTNGSVVAGGSNSHDDFAYDAYNGRIEDIAEGTPSFHFAAGQLFYQPGNGPSSVPALGGGGVGNYQLGAGSTGLDVGFPIPNFSDGFVGSAPDVGAHESGSASMTFGISASQ